MSAVCLTKSTRGSHTSHGRLSLTAAQKAHLGGMSLIAYPISNRLFKNDL